MPRVEKTTGGRLRTRVADQEFVAGETYEVDAETAEYLVDVRGGFEIVDAADTVAESAEESPDESADAADGGAESEDSGEFDVETYLDNNNAKEIAGDIRDGDVDDHLEEIGDRAERVTVQDAVGKRRAELEG